MSATVLDVPQNAQIDLKAVDFYCIPSTVIRIGLLPNIDGFKFIGVDRDGAEHDCTIRKGDSRSFYADCCDVRFDQLIGWLPYATYK